MSTQAELSATDTATAFTCQTVAPERPVPTLTEDVRAGLLEPPRSLPPKYFYDSTGSQLFDQICDTPEYYVTRSEESLLESYADDIISRTRPDNIIEIGSGTSRKTVHLLAACERQAQQCTYWPFDVCVSILRQAADNLMAKFNWLNVNAMAGDYLAGLKHMASPEGGNLYIFLGSTIGNFTPDEAMSFLSELQSHMGENDYLLIGADRVKDVEILEAAYNDAQGVTAQFNLNLLQVLNRELRGEFDSSAFIHQAVFNEAEQQIEMYLISQKDQFVRLEAMDVQLELSKGEKILTEISRKFTIDRLGTLMSSAGLKIEAHFEPENQYFSLLLCAAQPS